MNREKSVMSEIQDKSKEYLKSISAFELMCASTSLQKDIHNAIGQYKLPVSVIAGILTSELSVVLTEVDSIAIHETIMTVMQKRDEIFKRYICENFIKKEKV